MNKWVGAMAAVLMLAAALYFGSPYYAAHSLRAAALEADTDQLEARIDFPAVRDSLKSQLSVALMEKMQNDPEMRDNPFAGLGAMMMPAILDRMIDSLITPDGMAAVIRGQKPNDSAKAQVNPDIESQSEYVSLDRFRVRLRNTKLNEDGPSLLFERRGFATWKLIRVEIPQEQLQGR